MDREMMWMGGMNQDYINDELLESYINDELWERRLINAMKFLGYDKIELDKYSMATVGFRNAKTSDEILSDGWDYIHEFCKKNIPENNEKLELYKRLINEEKRIEYYTSELSDDVSIEFQRFLGDISDIVEIYNTYPAGKVIGLHIDDEYIVVGKYNKSEHQYDILSHEQYNYIIQNSFRFGDMEKLLDSYSLLIKNIEYDKVYVAVFDILNTLKNEALKKIKNPSEENKLSWYCRIANTNRPQDYLEISVNIYESEEKMNIKINTIHANEIVNTNNTDISIETILKREDYQNFNWNKEYMSMLDIKNAVKYLDTDFSYQFKAYSDDSIRNTEPLKEHISMFIRKGYNVFYPSESLTFVTGLTEDEKDALVEGVEFIRDYNEPVPKYEQALYDAIINERSKVQSEQEAVKEPDNKEYEIEVKETLSRVIKIKASSMDEATDKVMKEYNCGNIVLSADDFVHVNIEALPRDEKKDIKPFLQEKNKRENIVRQQMLIKRI